MRCISIAIIYLKIDLVWCRCCVRPIRTKVYDFPYEVNLGFLSTACISWFIDTIKFVDGLYRKPLVQRKLHRWKEWTSYVSIWFSACLTHCVKWLHKRYFLIQISFPFSYFKCPISYLQETILYAVTYTVISTTWYYEMTMQLQVNIV